MENFFGLVIAVTVFISFVVAFLVGKDTKRFKWVEYIIMVAPPAMAVFIWGIFFESKLIILYVMSALVGFVLEYLLGFSYHKILNKHLWYYSRLKVEGYTSLLTLPFWGLAGIVFWLLINIIGL